MSFQSQIMQGMPQGAFSSNGDFSARGMGDKQEGEKIPSGYRKYAVQNFTPEQMQLMQQMIEQLGPESFLAKLASGDPSQFEEMEAPALRQFNELQGGLASRFSGMGSGARHSSGFQNASNAAAQDFAGQLQANRLGLQKQGLNDLMGYSNELMQQKPYTTGLAEKRPKQPSGAGGLIGAGLGGAAGFFAGGPMGAMQGAQLGYGIGSSF